MKLHPIRSFIAACLAVVGLFCVAQTASAEPYCGDYGYGWRSVYYTQELSNIPYYALYPPVYYSVPVARTYGYSPFAYPPGTMTPDVELVNPEIIENPYAPDPPKAKPTGDKSAAAKPRVKAAAMLGKVVVNPYVSTARLTQSRAAGR